MKRNNFQVFNKNYLKLRKILPLKVAYMIATMMATTVM